MAEAVEADKVEQVFEEAEWFSCAVKLRDQFGLYIAVKFQDAATVSRAAMLVNEQIQQFNGEGPLAMVVPMLRSAIQVRMDGELLRVSVSGPTLRGAVAMVGVSGK